MEKIIENINRVLADWNPLEVPQDIALEEYRSFIPLILNSIGDRQQLIKCLEDILINKLELDYEIENKTQVDDLLQVCNKLIEVYQRARSL